MLLGILIGVLMLILLSAFLRLAVRMLAIVFIAIAIVILIQGTDDSFAAPLKQAMRDIQEHVPGVPPVDVSEIWQKKQRGSLSDLEAWIERIFSGSRRQEDLVEELDPVTNHTEAFETWEGRYE